MIRLFSLPIALVLGVLMHSDWHLARAGHHLGLGWRYHWLLAVPAFAEYAAAGLLAGAITLMVLLRRRAPRPAR